MAKGWLLPLALVLLCIQPLLPLTSAALTVTSTFNQSGVAGTIKFTQANAAAATIMDVSLTGSMPQIVPAVWCVHILQYTYLWLHCCYKGRVSGAELH